MTAAIDKRHFPIATLLATAMLGVCALVYWAGLRGGFLFDDFQHVVHNPLLRAIGTPAQNWLALALSSDAGILRRPLSMLSFGLNAYWFGINPMAFKAVNLAIHLLNGLLIYAIGWRLAERLTGTGVASVQPRFLGLLVAALWLLHPLNVSGVLYVVQRMNELSALFILAGLLCYIDGRLRLLQGERGLAPALIGLCVFGLLATASKENGALITAYALVVESFAFGFQTANASQRRALQVFFWLTLALPLALFGYWLAAQSALLNYSTRDFTLYQRVLSEARILCDYLLWIFIPDPAWMGFFHDDIPVSTSLLHPATTLPALLFLMALSVAAWKLRRRAPGFAFAVAWFLVGHSMESTILPLELVFEHRNYLPMAGLLLGVVCALTPFLAVRWPARMRTVVGASLVLACAGLTTQRCIVWGAPLELALSDARHHPDSAGAQYTAGRAVLIADADNRDKAQADAEAERYFARSAELDNNLIAPAAASLLLQASQGPVTQSSVADLARRLRRAPNYTQADPFLDMLVSASREKLSLTAADFATLVEAALANAHFLPKVRATIMLNYGSYLHSTGDLQGTVAWMLAADAEDPGNAYFQLNLAVIALQTRDLDRARQYLDAARRYDKSGIYAQSIDSLQRQLMQ
jgi:hypothetical protein